MMRWCVVPSNVAETVAKILFTSGSTGTPKGVPTTHRMVCTSLSQIETLWPFMRDHTPVILDWLPWSHVFGGSFSVNTVLRYGGTLHIDDGKPIPGEIARTLRNLREVRPTLYWNVPRGYELLLPLLQTDAEARQNFFGDLALMFYAGASLPASLWRELVRLGKRATGREIPMTTSWGLTETAPSITMINRAALAPGNIGIPMPGLELKLVPHQGKLEARVRGPNVMRGYWNSPEANAAAFDEEGFFRTGDAVLFADPADPAQGLIFDGRTTEDFKLLTGTWVDAAAVRLRAQAALAGLITDVVVTGADRNELGLLLLCAAGHDPDDAALPRKAWRSPRGPQQGGVRRVAARHPRDHHAAATEFRFRRDHRKRLAQCAPDPRAPRRSDRGALCRQPSRRFQDLLRNHRMVARCFGRRTGLGSPPKIGESSVSEGSRFR